MISVIAGVLILAAAVFALYMDSRLAKVRSDSEKSDDDSSRS